MAQLHCRDCCEIFSTSPWGGKASPRLPAVSPTAAGGTFPNGTGRNDRLFREAENPVGKVLFLRSTGKTLRDALRESGSLFRARRRWHRAQVSTVADDEQLAQETVALATALLESGRPQLPRPEP